MKSSQSERVLSHQVLEASVTQLVVTALGKQPGSIGPDDPLYSSQAGFDSFSLVELVLRLEDTFGISIPDEDLDPDVFHSVKTVADYVSDRLVQEG